MYAFEVEQDELQEILSVPLHRVRSAAEHLHSINTARVCKIEEITSVASGTYIEQYTARGLPYLRVDNIRPFVCNMNKDDVVYISPVDTELTARVVVAEGDVLIARTGTLGKAALAVQPISGAVMSQHVTRLTCNASIRPGYLAAFLNCDAGRYQLIYGGFGSTRRELTHGTLRAIRVPVLEDTVQESIHANIIEALENYYESVRLFDSAVATLEEIIGVPFASFSTENYFEVHPDRLEDLWTPRYYFPLHASVVDWLQAHFECLSLSDIARIERGRGTRVSEYSTRGIPFVRTSSLINYGIDPFPDYYASEDLTELFNQPVGLGDVLVSMEGKIGQVAYLTEADTCVFKNHIELVRCRKRYDPMFIFLVLAGRIGKLQTTKQMVVQSTIPGLGSRLREVVIPIRPKSEDRAGNFREQVQKVCQIGYKAAALRDSAISRLRTAQEELVALVLSM